MVHSKERPLDPYFWTRDHFDILDVRRKEPIIQELIWVKNLFQCDYYDVKSVIVNGQKMVMLCFHASDLAEPFSFAGKTIMDAANQAKNYFMNPV